jgi:hypothetical protein
VFAAVRAKPCLLVTGSRAASSRASTAPRSEGGEVSRVCHLPQFRPSRRARDRTQPPCVGPACSWAATLNNHAIKGGDGASLDDEDTVQVAAESDCEVLLFDLN